jgi:hypothetical protein
MFHTNRNKYHGPDVTGHGPWPWISREKTGLAKKNTLEISVLHEKNYDNLSTIIDIFIM